MLHSKLTKGVKRDPSLPKGRQIDDISEKEVKELVGNLSFDRSQLIEALHLIQDKFNCLSQRHLKSLSELFKLSQAEVFEVASFYHHSYSNHASYSAFGVIFCDASNCASANSYHVSGGYCQLCMWSCGRRAQSSSGRRAVCCSASGSCRRPRSSSSTGSTLQILCNSEALPTLFALRILNHRFYPSPCENASSMP